MGAPAPAPAIRLLDERARPTLRDAIGELLRTAESACMALTRIRLAHLDLTADEIAGPREVRVLLGHLDASTLLDAGGTRAETAAGLVRWAQSGRLQVRSAGIGAWTPDFSVYRSGTAVHSLLGAHYFGSPQLTVGPSFTAVTDDPGTARVLTRRFDGLWDASHDVLPAIVDVLERVRVGPAPAG